MAGWRPGRRHDSATEWDSSVDLDDISTGRRRGCLLPIGALVLGLLVGGGSVGFVMNSRQAAPPPVVMTATPTPPQDLTSVNVPRACLDIAEEARILQDLLDSSVQAARDLDAAELSKLVRQIDEQQSALQAHAKRCRQGMETPVPGVPNTGSPSSAPATPTRTSTAGTPGGATGGAGAGGAGAGGAATGRADGRASQPPASRSTQARPAPARTTSARPAVAPSRASKAPAPSSAAPTPRRTASEPATTATASTAPASTAPASTATAAPVSRAPSSPTPPDSAVSPIEADPQPDSTTPDED